MKENEYILDYYPENIKWTHIITFCQDGEDKTMYCKIPDEAKEEFEDMINSFIKDKKL